MTAILLNDFKLQWRELNEQILTAVSRVGESGYLILGEEVRNFEECLAEFWGIKYSIGCANGLDAIEIALRSLELKPGDKVLTTPLSAFATTLAILRAGGTPVFCDTDRSGLVDLHQVEEILETDSQIKFFVPVHLFGHALDLRELQRLKEVYQLKIVEDCAQSIGSSSFGRATGTVGQVAATSFYPTKNLGCYGDGGALLTNDVEIKRIARSLRDYGQTEKYHHSLLGLNSRLDEVQAAILRNALLPKLGAWTQRRREIAEMYRNQISHPEISFVEAPQGSDSCWHLFPIRVLSIRNSLREWLASKKISAAIHYPVIIPDQPVFTAVGTSPKNEIKTILTNARDLAQQELSLPIHPFLNDGEVVRVIEACNSWRR